MLKREITRLGAGRLCVRRVSTLATGTDTDKEYDPIMGIAIGTVVAGKVVVDGMDLPEGSIVTVLTPEPDEEVRLTAEEEAELLEAIAEVERGETISAEELFDRLDRIAKL